MSQQMNLTGHEDGSGSHYARGRLEKRLSPRVSGMLKYAAFRSGFVLWLAASGAGLRIAQEIDVFDGRPRRAGAGT
jgi:hypothetical protein